jgi:hypothetical protein
LKSIVFIIILLNFGINCSAQNFKLKIIGNSSFEDKIIDSLGYNSDHNDSKSIYEETNKFSGRLLKIGFLENHILLISKENDSSFISKFYLGKKTKNIHIYIGRNSTINKLLSLNLKEDTLILPYIEIETFLNNTIQKLEQKGFSFAQLKLIHLKQKNSSLFADLQYESSQERKLNSIVLKFEESNTKRQFPEGAFKQIAKKHKNKSFNQNLVKQINADFEKFRFVNQTKYPEILFTKDTTKVYVYLEKRKSNLFDGFIGFSNTKNDKININGYIDLTLENALKAGEQLLLFWKSDGKNQKTFKASIDFPYLFKSPIGLKAQINIFKQDSLFQNTKTAIDLGYLIDYNTRIYLGYQSTESGVIQKTSNGVISDFKNSFTTINLEYSKIDVVNPTFPVKTNLSLSLGTGKRETINLDGKNNQFYINLDFMHNFYLNQKNCININYHNYFLQSDTYIINELYRFGGFRSIRGFAENSLQANLASIITTEYRYIITPDLYIHSIMDYGYFQDKTTNNKGNLMTFGLGFGVKTKNGLLKLALANGSQNKQEFNFNNSIIHLNYTVSF